jgi:tRNA nucleotidyltransferase (CCA-adding enzyme)
MSDKVEEETLKKITPSKIEKRNLRNTISDLLFDAQKTIKDLKISAKPVVVGSVAKDTYL